MTQGRQLIAALRRKPHTYGEMMQVLMWQSTSPWKRAVEALKEDEQIVKGKRHIIGSRYLTTWRVVKATAYTA
jgi:hypothetical protein